ncbi:MAG TPA: hypothetical protein VGH28_25080 [Polyangiaceae bacterium]|jgi:hypothetical protein
MRRLAFGVLALSLAACVGDDSVSPPDAGGDATTFDAPVADAPQETAPTCTGTQTACGSACVDLQSDDANCGACGHACGTGSTCTSGFCPPVTLCNAGTGNGSNGSQLVVYKGAAYFNLGQSIKACNLGVTNATASDFSTTKLLQNSFTSIVGDPSFFYFVTHNTSTSSNSLTRCDGNTTDTTFITTYPSGGPGTYVRTDDDPSTGQVYEALTDEVDFVHPDLVDAGTPTSTCISQISTLATGAAGGGKYFFVDSSNKVRAVTITGGTCSNPVTVAGGLIGATALAAEGSTIAFADGNGNVYACDAALGCTPQVPPTPLVTGQGNGVLAIVLDSSTPPNLYWVGSAGLAKCSSAAGTCNGKPTVLVPNAMPTAGIALDASNVYYLQGATLSSAAK